MKKEIDKYMMGYLIPKNAKDGKQVITIVHLGDKVGVMTEGDDYHFANQLEVQAAGGLEKYIQSKPLEKEK